MGIRHGRDKRTGEHRADAGNAHQPSPHIRRPGARPDPAIILEDLGVHQSELVGEHLQAIARASARHSIVRLVMEDIDERQQPLAPDRRHNPELGHVAADRIRQLDALTHQHQTRAVQHQDALLLR